jgi:6-phosphofructokinase 1
MYDEDYQDSVITAKETSIKTLGEPKIPSARDIGNFCDDQDGVRVYISRASRGKKSDVYFQKAGPRDRLYFDSSKTKCAIVTCGGLCPGINDVIRAIVMEAHHNYRVSGVLGVRYGLEGFIPEFGHDIWELSPQTVTSIYEFGGTMLGTSRGPQDPERIVEALERMNVSCLFMIGGDGTMRAAAKVVEEIEKRGCKISVIGIPKTIDNDINFVARSFGFDTAVEKATEAIRCAHTEALGALNGIGLVKVMGRHAGHIAAQSSLSLKEVNFVLVPEDRFELQGENGLLAVLARRLEDRRHAVIVVAEGAGGDLIRSTGETDASGNPVLPDISGLLRGEIEAYMKERGMPYTLKYIDPSYIIRSIPANSDDRLYCGFLGQNAVHAAMAGKTGMVVSKWNGRFVHLPLHLVTSGGSKRINTSSNYWRAVLESTGQPPVMRNE